MLHKIQKVLSPGHGDSSHTTKDAAFDVAFENFGQFKVLHDRILTNSREFLDRLKYFSQSNHIVATDLYDLYSTGGDNQFKDLAGDFQRGHEQVLLRDSEQLLDEARTTFLQKVDRLGSMVIGLDERVKQRNHTLDEMDSYTAKVSKITKKEKPIEPGSKEERTEQRHQELVDAYTRTNMALTGELVDLWTNRNKIFNPLMADFAAVQAAFAELLMRGAKLNNASATSGGDLGTMRQQLAESLRVEPVHLAANIPFEFGQQQSAPLAGNLGGMGSDLPSTGSNLPIGSNVNFPAAAMSSPSTMGSGMSSSTMGSNLPSSTMGSNLPSSTMGSNMGSNFPSSTMDSNIPSSNLPSTMGSNLPSNTSNIPSSNMGSNLGSNITPPFSDTFAEPSSNFGAPLSATGSQHQPLTGQHQPLTGQHHHLTGQHHQPMTGSSFVDKSSVGILDRPVGATSGQMGEQNPQVCVVTPIGEVNKDFIDQEARRQRMNEF
jgi:hypothetical protein